MSDNLIGDADKNADSVSELEAAARLAQGPPISLYDYETRNNSKTRPQSSGCRQNSVVHFGDSYHYGITKQKIIVKLPTGPAHAPGGPPRARSSFTIVSRNL